MSNVVAKPKDHRSYIDLNQNELRNARIQNLGADPGSPVDGQVWYRSDLDEFRVRIDGVTYTLATTADIGAGTVVSVVAGSNIDVDATDPANPIVSVEALTSADLTDFAEAVSDQIGTMVTGNTETGIAVTYQDGDNTLDFVVDFSGSVMDGDAAGGVLSGTYPNPGFASDMATQAELDAHVNDTTDAHDASAISYSPSGDISSTDVQAAVLEALADAKAYADAVAAGLKLHTSVVLVETSANLDLTGTETIDGVSTPNGARVLLTAQSDADENGIWLANTGGAWTRPADFDAAGEVVEGAYTFVEEGSTYEGTGWTLAEVAGSFGSLTQQVWTQFSGAGEITAGAALTKTGNTLDVAVSSGIEVSSDALRISAAAAGNGLTGGAGSALAVGAGTGISVAADAVAVDTAVVVRKYATDIGNGSLTAFTVTHNLGTRDVTVAVFENSTFEQWDVDIAHTTTNTITVTFTGHTPTSNQFRVVVHA